MASMSHPWHPYGAPDLRNRHRLSARFWGSGRRFNVVIENDGVASVRLQTNAVRFCLIFGYRELWHVPLAWKLGNAARSLMVPSPSVFTRGVKGSSPIHRSATITWHFA